MQHQLHGKRQLSQDATQALSMFNNKVIDITTGRMQ